MLGRLFLLFTLVPLAELYLLIAIGGQVGVVPTLALIGATGLLGAWLAKREGRKALANYRDALAEGRLPEDGIVSSLLILVGGVLLVAPGVLTDVMGLSLMIPPVRRAVARMIVKRAEAKIQTGELQVMELGPEAVNLGGAPFEGARDSGGGVVDVEVVDTPR